MELNLSDRLPSGWLGYRFVFSGKFSRRFWFESTKRSISVLGHLLFLGVMSFLDLFVEKYEVEYKEG